MLSGEAIAEEWMKNFRMPREQFEALADELSPHISPDPSSPGMGQLRKNWESLFTF